jgi:hypothetical protein
VLSGVSVIVMLPAALLWRLEDPSTSSRIGRVTYYRAMGSVFAIVAYIIGVAGFAIGISSAKPMGGAAGPTGSKLSSSHARAGVAFFAIAYCVLPVVGAIALGRKVFKHKEREHTPTPSGKSSSDDHNLVAKPNPSSATRSAPVLTTPPSLSQETQLSLTSLFGGSEAVASEEPTRGFEVVNRRRKSQSVALDRAFPSSEASTAGVNTVPTSPPRSERASDALSPTAVSSFIPPTLPQALPYQSPNSPSVVPLNTAQAFQARPRLPVGRRLGSILLQAVILFGIVYLLVSIHGNAILFGLAIAWAALYYLGLAALAWTGSPSFESILVNLLSGFRGRPTSASPVQPSPATEVETGAAVAGAGAAGVVQAAPKRQSGPPSSFFSGRPLSDDSYAVYFSDGDEDLDEESLQRRAEHEMSEREVVVMTVPRRQLRITN